jgi:cell division protein ZapA (FtsZ GTPase activity inhibitor)
MAENVEISIRGRKMVISAEGLTSFEISSIVKKIEEEMKRIEEENDVVDTFKQLMLVSIKYAMESYKKDKLEKTKNLANENKLEEVIEKMEEALNEEKLF